MKQGFLIITEGTTEAAGLEDLRIIREEILERFPESEALISYTDDAVRKKAREESGEKRPGIRAAMLQMKEMGVQSLTAVTTEVCESTAYDKEKEEIHGCASLFREMHITGPLLTKQEEIPVFSRCMASAYSEAAAGRVPVFVMEKKLGEAGEKLLPLLEQDLRGRFSEDAHVISLQGGKKTKKVLTALEEAERREEELLFIPLSFLGGTAFRSRITEGELSPVQRVSAAGHSSVTMEEGLGAYDEFLRLYLKRIYEANN